jgi:hypothetical protein
MNGSVLVWELTGGIGRSTSLGWDANTVLTLRIPLTPQNDLENIESVLLKTKSGDTAGCRKKGWSAHQITDADLTVSTFS